MSSAETPAAVTTPLARLNAALEDVADALASADLARLLAAEPELGAALDGMAGAAEPDPAALEQARSALLRCRRLGAGLVTFTRLSLDPEGAQAYARRGGAHLTARAAEMEARG